VTLAAKVLTVSDGVAAGTREDRSGPALVDRLGEAGFAVVDRRVAPDGVGVVADALTELTRGFAGLVVTTGGTGFGPRDCTPEGTRRVLEADGRGFGMLARGVCGTVGAALVCNLPGSAGGAVECLDAVLPVVPHALDLLAGGHPH